MRPTWAEVDLAPVEANVQALCAHVAPTPVCAVVKADGYGHGATAVARSALAGGAESLAVALVEEGAQLRDAGITAPILVLSEVDPADARDVVALRIEPTVYTTASVSRLAEAARESGGSPLPVHLKVDTGMHRVGARPEEAVALAQAVAAEPQLRMASLWTHLAVADEPEDPHTDAQLKRFDEVVRDLEAAGLRPPRQHVANSAAAITRPDTRLDLVRCGIAIYGIDPSPALAGLVDLRPALRLVSRVTFLKRVAAGQALSYGQRYRLDRESTIATVPIGYADGLRRRLGEVGGEVLIGGRRLPIAGTITMDQILVDCGDQEVAVGDEVVLIGRQADDEIAAAEVAERLETIGYEIVCAIGGRVPRHHIRPAG